MTSEFWTKNPESQSIDSPEYDSDETQDQSQDETQPSQVDCDSLIERCDEKYGSPSSNRNTTVNEKEQSDKCEDDCPTDWSCNTVKVWASKFFGEKVGDNFFKEEVDGETLLAMDFCDKRLDKLGISTLGRINKFHSELQKIRDNSTSNSVSKKRKIFNQDEEFSLTDIDRLLTNTEKNTLTFTERSTYNTKKKKILQRIKQRWPEDKPTPWFRNNTENTTELQKFVDTLSCNPEYIYPAAGLQRNSIEELVRRHMQERRRKQKDMHKTSGGASSDSSSTSTSSPEPLTAHKGTKRNANYESYFNKDLTSMSAQAIVIKWFGKNTVTDLKMDVLRKEAKIAGLYLLRNKDKETHINAIASMLLNQNKVSISENTPLSKVATNDVQIIGN